MASIINTIFSVVQFVVLAYIASRAIRVLHFCLIYSNNGLEKYKSRSGKSWALVTGASDGIGKGFSQELCRLGFNVMIHGRNEKKLQGVKAQLEKDFPGREIRLLVLDAVKTDWNEQTDAYVRDAVGNLNLTILINNVGGGAGSGHTSGPLTSKSAEEVDGWINMNARFMSQITRVLIPVLSKDKSQKSVIANISSGAELLPAIHLVAYAATKAYVSRWSISLEAELRAQGFNIDVHSYIVGAVATANAGYQETQTTLFTPSPKAMARAGLEKLGNGHVVCAPYWPHGLQAFAMTKMPAQFLEKFMVDMTKDLNDKRLKMQKGT